MVRGTGSFSADSGEIQAPNGQTIKQQTPQTSSDSMAQLLQQPNVDDDLVQWHDFKAEVFSLQLPFFFLSDIDEITIGKPDGPKYWNVAPHPKYGKPEELAFKLHRSYVEQVLSEMPKPLVNPIPLGSLYRIAKRLKVGTGGKNGYGRIKTAFDSIIHAAIKAKGYNAEFSGHLYSQVVYTGKTLPGSEAAADQVYLWLSPWYLANINTHKVRPLNLEFYESLSLDERRLYELLGPSFYKMFEYHDGTITPKFSYANFKYSRLCLLFPLRRKGFWSKERRLSKACKRLTEKGYLVQVEIDEIGKDQFGHDWLLKFYPGDRAKDEVAHYKRKSSGLMELPLETEPMLQPEIQREEKPTVDSDLSHKLIKLGLSQSQMEYVCKTYDRDKIIDWLNSQRYWRKKADNPAAWFLKALEGDWTPPSEYFRRKNAKHYVMWQCSNYDLCENSLKVFKSPKERVPTNFSSCPKCGKAVTIFDPDRIEYPD